MEFDVHYSPALMRSVVRRHMAMRFGWSGWIAVGISLPLALAMIVAGPNGRARWLLAGLLATVVAVTYRFYQVSCNRYLKRISLLKDPRTTYRITEEHLQADNELGHSEFPWDRFRILRRFPSLWLLFFTSNDFIILPTADLGPEASEALIERLTAHGVVVR